MSTNAPIVWVPLHFDWAQVRLKVKLTLTSRKFWVMIAALLTVWGAHGLAPGQVTLLNAVQGTIAALGLFSTGVAIEGIGAGSLPGILASTPGRVLKEQVIRIVQAWLLARGIGLDVGAVEQLLEQVAITAATPSTPPAAASGSTSRPAG